MIPSTVAFAPSVFAYSTIGLLSTIWNERALNIANKNALFSPDGSEVLSVSSLKWIPAHGRLAGLLFRRYDRSLRCACRRIPNLRTRGRFIRRRRRGRRVQLLENRLRDVAFPVA